MKFKVKNSLLESVVKAEAKKLKEELMGGAPKSRLSEIKNRKNNIQTQLNEMYQEEELDEFFGAGKFKKAKNAFKEANAQELGALIQAYKAKDMSYIELSKSLVNKVNSSYVELANQFGLTDPSDMKTLRKDLLELVQPMNFNTFKAQAQGGTSMSHFGAGTGSAKI